MKGYIYILRDKNGKFYIGSTNNIKRRLKQHKAKYSYTTSRMLDPELVLTQKYETLETARKVERKIKKLKRKDYVEKMIKDGYIKITT